MSSSSKRPVRVGVIGVGSMGEHHVRNYNNLVGVDLAGIVDADEERAASVAEEYETEVWALDSLLEDVEAVSVAVPTPYHYDVARTAMERGVHTLVEKPMAETVEEAKDLVAVARRNEVTLQVGHIERFNPAFEVLKDIVADLDVIAIDARRLSPPVKRDIGDSAVMDLMIHDLDIALSLLDGPVTGATARGTLDNQYMTAMLEFGNGVIANFTASRVTQQKVRQLSITARNCHVTVDYIDQDVKIHRRSVPNYVSSGGSVRYRHEGIIEQPMVNNGEPLERELSSFVEAVRTGTRPEVTGEDGLRALDLAKRLDRLAAEGRPELFAET